MASRCRIANLSETIMRSYVRMLRRAPLALLVLMIVLAAGAAPIYAQAPADSILHACYVPNTGTVYRIKLEDTRQACASDKHVQFSWNAVGPVGPQGPQGIPGASGTPGTSGAPGGVSGYEIVTAEFGPMLLREFEGSVSCPAGKRVLGGGATAASSAPPAKWPPTLSSSTMLPDGTGWSAKGLWTSSDISWLLHVSAICANVTP